MIERIARALCMARYGHLRGYNKAQSIRDRYAREAQAVLTELSAGDGVQECDREAAAEMSGAYWRDDILAGECDDLAIVQAFARHRTLAAAAERARRDKEIVAWLRGHEALSRVGDKFTVLMADAIEAGEV